MIHEMHLLSAAFEKIRSGKKIVEVRLNDEKRRKIRQGDTIVFTERNTNRTLVATVTKLTLFNTFEELYGALPKAAVGHAETITLEEQVCTIHTIYTKANEQRFGVLAIHLSSPQVPPKPF